MVEKIIFLVFLITIVTIVEAQQKFTILQFNDIHSQLESFVNGTNPPIPSSNSDAVGGLGKLIGELEHHESSSDRPTLRVSAGNLLSGFNGWLSVLDYSTFKEAVSRFYAVEEQDGQKYFLQGFGLKEFEGGVRQTNDYIDLNHKPIISNIDCTAGDMDDHDRIFCGIATPQPMFDSYRIINVGSTRVGVVGFVNPLAMNLSDPGHLIFRDPATSLTDLTSRDFFKDVNTVLAIGGGSLDIAKRILDTVDKVKVVLYSGGSDSPSYPREYNGKYIGATSAFKYGTNLGKLTFTIKPDGGVTLDSSEIVPVRDRVNVPAQTWVTELRTSEEIINATTEVVGKTLVRLEGTREVCWRAECNLGNLVADSLIHCAVNDLDDDVNIHGMVDLVAVWNGGSLFNDTVAQFEDIYVMDVHKWLPYHNNAYLVILKGRDLRQMFRESGKGIVGHTMEDDWGRFLQVSDGVEVLYKTNGDLGSLQVWHTEDQIPSLSEVQDEIDYHLVIPSTLYRGRNAYAFLKGKFQPFPSGVTYKSIDFDDNCLRRYIEAMGVLKIGFQGRIFIGHSPHDNNSCTGCSAGDTALTVFLTILILGLILGISFVSWKYAWPRFQQWRRTTTYP